MAKQTWLRSCWGLRRSFCYFLHIFVMEMILSLSRFTFQLQVGKELALKHWKHENAWLCVGTRSFQVYLKSTFGLSFISQRTFIQVGPTSHHTSMYKLKMLHMLMSLTLSRLWICDWSSQLNIYYMFKYIPLHYKVCSFFPVELCLFATTEVNYIYACNLVISTKLKM